MNAVTTDHPMVARPSCSDAKDNPLLSFCGSAVLVALVLCPLFLGVTWFAALGGDNPDVPQRSSAEFIFDAVGFILAFPAFFFSPSHGSLLTPVGFTEDSFIYFG